MENVVITGAGGFIGKNLIKRMVNDGKKVIALDIEKKRKDIYLSKNVLFVPMSFDNYENCIEILKDEKVEVFYHLAWIGVTTDLKNNLDTQLINIGGCYEMMKLCKRIGCNHMVIPGSASEYAYCNEVITGYNVPSPSDSYASCKASARIISELYAKQNEINLNWLIISSIYGPGRDDNNIITYTIQKLLRGEKPSYTQMEQKWDYIYIDDLIEAFSLIGRYGKKGKSYPVGSGEAQSLKSYIENIRNIIDPKLPLGIGEYPYKLGSKPDNSILDISELVKDTGFMPKITFDEGIRRTITFFKDKEVENV